MNYRTSIPSLRARGVAAKSIGAIFLGFALSVAAASSLAAEEMDIDQADSLNFQSFHKDKKEAVKVWDKKSEPTKAYSEQPVTSTSAPAANATATNAPAGSAIQPTAGDLKGKRFELRERYTLTRSAQTPYSAFYVIEPLYKQAAQLCPKGWKKVAERSEPIEQDFFLYYEIECL